MIREKPSAIFRHVIRLGVVRDALALGVCTALAACAGVRAAEGSAVDSACEECGERGELELEIVDEKGFVEINPHAWERLDSTATLGSFPALRISAKCPEGEKICHSFSEDAVDFDLAHFEDSIIVRRFPRMTHEQMLEGLRVPESDSLWIRNFKSALLRLELADGKRLEELSPWDGRAASPIAFSAFDRPVPDSLKSALMRVAKRYNVRYISVPVWLQVEILPKIGRSGGFSWTSLWTLWDAREGSLTLLAYDSFTAKTTGRVSPERSWAKPFAERLGKALDRNPGTIENH